MSPGEIRRSWDDDDTPRSVFPEPLAERLTRENKELRAEVERWTGDDTERPDWDDKVAAARALEFEADRADAAEARLDALVADLRSATEWRDVREFGDELTTFSNGARKMAMAIRGVLDKHAGEQP